MQYKPYSQFIGLNLDMKCLLTSLLYNYNVKCHNFNVILHYFIFLLLFSFFPNLIFPICDVFVFYHLYKTAILFITTLIVSS